MRLSTHPHFHLERRGAVKIRAKFGLIWVPATIELQQALDGIWRLPGKQAVPSRYAHLVISETTGRPYKEDHFRHEFARIRDLAGLPAGLLYMDLRRTAVLNLARSSCTVPEIGSITGHSFKAITQILEVYLPRHTELAKSGIVKLEQRRAAIELNRCRGRRGSVSA